MSVIKHLKETTTTLFNSSIIHSVCIAIHKPAKLGPQFVHLEKLEPLVQRETKQLFLSLNPVSLSNIRYREGRA